MMKAPNEVVTLIKPTATYTDGIRVAGQPERTDVFASIKSVMGREFYEALKSGQRVDIVVAVNVDEYDDQPQLEYNSKPYRVVRTYVTDEYTIELTCSEVK